MFQKAKEFLFTKFSSAQTTGLFLMFFVTVMASISVLWMKDMLESSAEEKWSCQQEKETAQDQVKKDNLVILEKDNLLAKMPTEKSVREAAVVASYVSSDQIPEPEKPADAVEETGSEPSPEFLADAKAKLDAIAEQLAALKASALQGQAVPVSVQTSADTNAVAGVFVKK